MYLVIIVLSMCTDYIDIVADHVPHSEYKEEEDPRIYKSKKSGRGPLGENWRSQNAVMCIYKLCKVSNHVRACTHTHIYTHIHAYVYRYNILYHSFCCVNLHW